MNRRRRKISYFVLPWVLLAGVTGALVLSGLGHSHPGIARAASTMQKGPPASAFNNTWPTTLPQVPLPDPSSLPSNVCGAWSAQDGQLASAMAASHGKLDECGLVDHYWILVTERGYGSGPSDVGILACAPADATCLDGHQAKSYASFTWTSAPPAFGYLRIAITTGDTAVFYTAQGEQAFDLTTGSFTGPFTG